MSILPFTAELFTAERCLIAVSGGRDSVALLHWLASAEGQICPVVCHYDHAVREDSHLDADFVKGLAVKYQCEFESDRSSRSLSSEEEARDARYEFFARCAKKHETSNLLLAHHADDQVETVFLNFCRGGGARGLSGMRQLSHREVGGVRLTLHRPWISVSREEINCYIETHKLGFREDSTNEDIGFTARNRLRKELSLALNREIGPAILRSAELLRGDDEALEELVDQIWSAVDNGAGALNVATLSLQPLGLQRRIVRRWLCRIHELRKIGFVEVETVLTLLPPYDRAPSKVNLPGGKHVRRKAGTLFVE